MLDQYFSSLSPKEPKAANNAEAKDKSGSAHEDNNSGRLSPAATVSAAKRKAPGYMNQLLGNKQGMAHRITNKADAHGEDAKIVKVKAMS